VYASTLGYFGSIDACSRKIVCISKKAFRISHDAGSGRITIVNVKDRTAVSQGTEFDPDCRTGWDGTINPEWICDGIGIGVVDPDIAAVAIDLFNQCTQKPRYNLTALPRYL
jgi:hypothetical protein